MKSTDVKRKAGRPPKPPEKAIYPIGASYAYIPLNKGLYALVDWDDAPHLEQLRWTTVPNKNRTKFYAILSAGAPPKVWMHRLILKPAEHLKVDHINGERLHNMRFNLRSATNTQNLQNRDISTNNTSGYKGVSLHTGETGLTSWRARIRVNGKEHHLGLFADPEDAYSAYCTAAEAFFGEFARCPAPKVTFLERCTQ